MDDLELWTTKLRLHRPLDPLHDEMGDGLRQTSFRCPGDSLNALLHHYETVTHEAAFRSVGRSIAASAFSLTLEKDDILLTVSCVADSHTNAAPLLTFMADHARKRTSSRAPSGVIDAWDFCVLPLEGSIPDAFEDGTIKRSYRFLTQGSPNAIAMYFRAVALQAGLSEVDCVESEGAISLTLRGLSRTLEVSAWADASLGPKRACYSVTLRRDD